MNDNGSLQRSALQANKIVGYAEAAKDEFFDYDELGDRYSNVFQGLDVIEQRAENYLSEIERKADLNLHGFRQYPVERADNLEGYLDGISTAAELALYFNDPMYDDGLGSSREEFLLKDIMDEVDRISTQIYGRSGELDIYQE